LSRETRLLTGASKLWMQWCRGSENKSENNQDSEAENEGDKSRKFYPALFICQGLCATWHIWYWPASF